MKKNLERFIKILKKYNLAELRYEDSDFSIYLKKNPQTNQKKSQQASHQTIENKENLIEIKAPILGYFHKEVEEGQEVKANQLLAKIEILNNFYEIHSPAEGIVQKILLDNEMPVEYNQKLILLKVK